MKTSHPQEAQTLPVRRAQVEFHKFASLGQPERVLRTYAEENDRRRGIIRKHIDFIGPMSPFLEIGANAGHTSYMLANDFGADGFALDLSADALRYGVALRDAWGLERTPVRVAGDALNLPFRDGSLRLVMAFQMLSQFMDIERVFLEVKRVLAPGGVFFFAEEPLRRMLSLRLWHVPYYEAMKPWERKLQSWGLLDFLIRDVVGTGQEESFGIRQNHSLDLKGWRGLIEKHFVSHRYEIFTPECMGVEKAVKRLAIRMDPHRSVWRAARLLGGTLSALCRKEGDPPAKEPGLERFETLLRCPDCHGALARDETETLGCACGYRAPIEGGVYNLLPSADKRELYPGERADIIDFSVPGHEKVLLEGWHGVEGVFGNKYRWIGPRASLRLVPQSALSQRLRIRGHASERCFEQGRPVRLEVSSNGRKIGRWTLERKGLFVLEADLPDAPEHTVVIEASPSWQSPPDTRVLTVNLSLVRLIEQPSRS
ncbi:MAG: methyltransferase domain-containing protein [Bryobacteraceae bacterium]